MKNSTPAALPVPALRSATAVVVLLSLMSSAHGGAGGSHPGDNPFFVGGAMGLLAAFCSWAAADVLGQTAQAKYSVVRWVSGAMLTLVGLLCVGSSLSREPLPGMFAWIAALTFALPHAWLIFRARKAVLQQAVNEQAGLTLTGSARRLDANSTGQAVLEAYEGGISIEDIAVRVGKTQRAVMATLARAREEHNVNVRAAARASANSISSVATNAAANTHSPTKEPSMTPDAQLASEYQALLTELSPVFGNDGDGKPAKGDMAKLQRLGRLAEMPMLESTVDKSAVVQMLEKGIEWIDDVYGPGNGTGKTRLTAFEKSASALGARAGNAPAAPTSRSSKARTARFGLPFDVDAFAEHFPSGWTLVKKMDDERRTLLTGPQGALISAAPHQLAPSRGLFEAVEAFADHFGNSGGIEAFTTSIGAQGWQVEVKDGNQRNLMLELWGPALMSVRFVYEAATIDPAIKAALQQAALNLVWSNATGTRSSALPVKTIKDLRRHIRAVLKGNNDLRDAVLDSFDADGDVELFVHEIEAIVEEGAQAYPLARALISFAMAHDAHVDVDDLCKLQSWCGVHFLDHPELQQVLAARARSTADSTRDFLELASVARPVGDSARDGFLQSAVAAAKSTDDYLKTASHPVIARDPDRVRRLLDAALVAATDMGDLREVLCHDAASADLLPSVLAKLRGGCKDKAFLSSPGSYNPLDVLSAAVDRDFMSIAAAEVEILSLVDGSPVLSDVPEPASDEPLPMGESEGVDGDDLGKLIEDRHGASGEPMHLLSLARSAANEGWDVLTEAFLERAIHAAVTPGRKYAVHEFLNDEELHEDPARAEAYLEANRAALQPLLDRKRDEERHGQLMDLICQCALLVAVGDNQITGAEREEIPKVRSIVDTMYRNRHAIAVLEQTEDIEKARALLRGANLRFVDGGLFLFEPAYSREIGEQLSELTSLEELDALCRLYAARIEDPFGRRLAAWAATEVAAIDGFDKGEMRALKIMADVWALDLKENRQYFRDRVHPLIDDDVEFSGRSKAGLLDQARESDDAISQAEDGDAAMHGLAEVLGEDTMAFLARLLGKAGEEEAVVEDTTEIPPAFLAAVTGNQDWPEALRLVRAGADVNDTINTAGMAGLSLLHFAASEHGSLAVVRALVEAGADVNLSIGNQRHMAGFNTPLVASLKGDGRMDIFDYLLEAGANPDPFGDREAGWTPLTIAAQNVNFEALKALISRGVDVNIARHDGANAFKILAVTDSAQARKCMDALIKAGIDTTRTDEDGYAGIHNAVCSVSARHVRYLIETAKVPVDLPMRARPHDFPTPLLRAMAWGNVPVVDYLLSKGADPSVRSQMLGRGIFEAIGQAAIDGSLDKPLPQVERLLATGLKPTFGDIERLLTTLSTEDDEHFDIAAPCLDALVAAADFAPDALSALDADSIEEKLDEALDAAPLLTARLLASLSKRGVDLENIEESR